MYEITSSRVSSVIDLYHNNELTHYKMESSLMKIYSRPNGKRLIDEITQRAGNDKKIRVFIDYEQPTLTYGHLNDKQRRENDIDMFSPFYMDVISAEQISHKPGLFRKGKGVGSTIRWNPNDQLDDKKNEISNEELEKKTFVGLAHELVHSLRKLKGTSKANEFNLYPNHHGKDEERRAIGIGRHHFKKLSENAIRLEHGLPRRDSI
ncbi:hypothetical protein F3J37_01660 [Pantoea sp. Al-1710]|uniref:Effector protein n=1 Tax=Candidatus Pantoea communis TaxID=2608354 RepID=A0ABX0RIB0_9GAMM|nr:MULTISPECIES: M91 family zinc metallopeptidase [Pantoea]NIG12914.1 hypothetical protein [Pantoea sp. Cy-640]NIG17385.1 hypothetical protein [Pantoea communis]